MGSKWNCGTVLSNVPCYCGKCHGISAQYIPFSWTFHWSVLRRVFSTWLRDAVHVSPRALTLEALIIESWVAFVSPPRYYCHHPTHRKILIPLYKLLETSICKVSSKNPALSPEFGEGDLANMIWVRFLWILGDLVFRSLSCIFMAPVWRHFCEFLHIFWIRQIFFLLCVGALCTWMS